MIITRYFISICFFIILVNNNLYSNSKEIYELKINKELIIAKDLEQMSKVKISIEKYIKDIQEIGSKKGREVSYRTPLENLFKSILNIIETKENLNILHEGKIKEIIETTSRKIPDFIVYKENKGVKALVGSIEAKNNTINLENIQNSQQAKDYSTLTPNLLLTNYKEFRLTTVIDDQVTVIKKVKLLDDDFNSLLNDEQLENFIDLVSTFYKSKVGYTITRKDLAKLLAERTKEFKESIINYCANNKQDKFCTKLQALHSEYNKIISIEQDFNDFMESYSQSFIYGIIISKLTYEQENNKLFLLEDESVRYLNDLYEEFSSYYEMLYEFLETGIDSNRIPNDLQSVFMSTAKTFNLISFADILANENVDFNKLVVYLYEDYLKEYDNLTRKANGVYYTPEPIVDFIVKSTDDALSNNLSIKGGFINEKVKVLDFATGTGSFLLSLYKHKLKEIGNSNKQKDKLTQKIENDYYGFELMFAPYIVAHTNLIYNLKQNKINVETKLPIYLTNTLDLSQNSISNLLPELAHNYEQSQEVKQSKNIIAIIGNPPYNSKSNNKGEEILGLLENYKKDLNETTINSLSDDYVKFLRFAEHKIEQSGYGVIGIITNNSYLNGVTHRQMRKHLLKTFDDIYIINLHGNSLIKEGDDNVFDIRVGTSITLFIKNKDSKQELANVYYFSTLDNNLISREEKFKFLQENNLDTIQWQKLNTVQPYYFFVEKDFDKQKEYESFWSLVPSKVNKLHKNIFDTLNSGIKTAKDDFTIHYNKNSLNSLRENIKKLSMEEIRKKYNIGKDKLSWNLKYATDDLIKNYNPQPINYRPLDVRYTSLSKESNGFMERPRYSIMKHFDNKDNLGLVIARTIDDNIDYFNRIYISKYITDLNVQGPQDYLVPLYLYSEENGLLENDKQVNFSLEFKEFLKTLSFKPTPEEIIYYIYAVMHHKSYRTDYLEFLKIDFPRVPITTDKKIFYEYSSLGKKLSELHIMDNIPEDNSIDYTCYHEDKKQPLFKVLVKDFIIDKIKYNETTLTLLSGNNTKIVITNLTKNIWKYQIGSYQVIDKWLKYRKKDNVILSKDDINHIINMIVTIKNTIKLQEEISSLDLP